MISPSHEELKFRAENSLPRSSTLSQPNATSKAFTCILTTICPKVNGAVPSLMAMVGSVIPISVLRTGRADCRIWLLTYGLSLLKSFSKPIPNLRRHHLGPTLFPSACVTNCDLHLTTFSSQQSHTIGGTGTRICVWVPTL